MPFHLTFAWFLSFLSAHQTAAYVILGVGSYVETLIGPSFFIPGELFFIPAALLGGAGVLNIWLVALVCYGGGILGDSSSYFIGKRFGSYVISILHEERKIFNPKNYEKGEEFFKSHGPKAIFIARILGPFSWVTPFLAGLYGVSYPTFLTYNIPGIFVGIGWFLVVGYFFANQYTRILALAKDGSWIILAVALLAGLTWWFLRRRRKQKVGPSE